MIKQKILVFSAYIGIYKALWYGLYEIFNSLCDHLIKIGGDVDPLFQKIAEDLTTSVKKAKSDSELVCYIDIPMQFSQKDHLSKHQTMITALKRHMKSETHLFEEPGVYPYMINGMCL